MHAAYSRVMLQVGKGLKEGPLIRDGAVQQAQGGEVGAKARQGGGGVNIEHTTVCM